MKFRTDTPIDVRLSATARTALGGLPDADIPLWGAEIEGGWLLADYKEANGGIRRYAVPSEHVIYVRQLLPEQTAPEPARARV